MDSDLKKAFKKAIYHPERRLSDDVWTFIENQTIKRNRIKAWLYGLLGVISFVGFIPALINLLAKLSKSGFYNYVSLLFQGQSVATYWKELSLSILSSMPIISLSFTVFLLLVLFISIKQTLRQFVFGDRLLAF